MKKEEIKLLIEVSKMYYEEDMKQEVIAQQLGISRPKVSRCLKKAKEMGYVKITILDPFSKLKNKEAKLAEVLGLKGVGIAAVGDDRDVKSAVGERAAEFLKEILKPNDIIGVGWGTSLVKMTEALRPCNIPNLTVVQIKGAISCNNLGHMAYTIVEKFSEKLKAALYYLPVPVLLNNKEIKEQLMNDPNIAESVRMSQKANIAIFSIGYPSEKSIIAKCGYITGDILVKMRKKGAVGDICSRFFTIEGEVFDPELDERNTSIELSELRNKEYSIGIASAVHSVQGIMGAIAGGYINCLITDEETADKLLALHEENKSDVF